MMSIFIACDKSWCWRCLEKFNLINFSWTSFSGSYAGFFWGDVYIRIFHHHRTPHGHSFFSRWVQLIEFSLPFVNNVKASNLYNSSLRMFTGCRLKKAIIHRTRMGFKKLHCRGKHVISQTQKKLWIVGCSPGLSSVPSWLWRDVSRWNDHNRSGFRNSNASPGLAQLYNYPHTVCIPKYFSVCSNKTKPKQG